MILVDGMEVSHVALGIEVLSMRLETAEAVAQNHRTSRNQSTASL